MHNNMIDWDLQNIKIKNILIDILQEVGISYIDEYDKDLSDSTILKIST